ncbi:MAG TPA: hypothetical protein VKD24_03460 [Candidatus Angelobacter sp.]|nr:hypothetical protein [Candidatus Angelobacter sp.]
MGQRLYQLPEPVQLSTVKIEVTDPEKNITYSVLNASEEYQENLFVRYPDPGTPSFFTVIDDQTMLIWPVPDKDYEAEFSYCGKRKTI